MSATVTPIEGEPRRYHVQSRTRQEPWLVDTEENVCACQEFYGRKVSGCWHLDQAKEFEFRRGESGLHEPDPRVT